MKRDKEEFKARNKDESFIKDKRPDIQLGRHAENSQEKQGLSPSKKNRMYQARQEYAEPLAVTAETPNKADLVIDFIEQESLSENPQEQAANDEQPEQTQEDFSELADSGSQDRNTDMPKHEPPKQTASKKNRVYQKHTETAQKPVDLDIPQKTAEQPPDEPSPHTKADDYNIRDAVQDKQTEFERNTDVDFSKVSADKDSNIPFDRVQTSGNKRIDNLQLTIDNDSKKSRNKLQQRKNVIVHSQSSIVNDGAEKGQPADGGKNPKQENPEGTKPNNGGVPFDRVTKFEQKAEKARAKADKAQQALPKKNET